MEFGLLKHTSHAVWGPFFPVGVLLHLQGGEVILPDSGGIKVLHLEWCYRSDLGQNISMAFDAYC